MLEIVRSKVKKIIRSVDLYLERNKYGYIEKLPPEIKYPEGSLYDTVYESSCKWPRNTAISYFDVELSYKELIKKINKVARALKFIGAEKGEHITVCMPNTPEAVYMFYAINEIGAVANMIHPLSSEKEIEEYINQAKSKIILCIDIAYPKIENIIKNTDLEQIIVVSATRSMDFIVRAIYRLTKGRKNHIKRSQQVITWNKFLLNSNKYLGNTHAHVNADDPAVILYSGGTTGKPKGVVLTNQNFNAQALGAKYLVPELLKPSYSMLTFLPNFHAFGLGVCMHIPLFCGMRIVLIPQFNAKKLKKYIKRYRINILVGVPTVFEYFMKIKFGPKELKRIKGVVSGGDVVSQALKNRFNDFLLSHGSKAIIHNGYGLTEAAGGMVFSPASVAKNPNAIGFPLPDSEVLIVNKNYQIMSAGKDGEMLVRGLTIMKEYLNNKKETESAFIKIGRKKYLKTGDIGHKDKQGVVYFKGRIKRMIITNGYNVYPTNIEEVTLKSKYVSECACVGIPDSLRGEIVKVFIVSKNQTSERIIYKDLMKIYKKYLAKYEIPREIKFIKSLPKTKLGKIDFIALQKEN